MELGKHVARVLILQNDCAVLGSVISIEYVVVVFVWPYQILFVFSRERYLLAVSHIYNVERILSIHKLALIVRRDPSWREAARVDNLGRTAAEDVRCRERMMGVSRLSHPVGVRSVRCSHAGRVIELYWLHRL